MTDAFILIEVAGTTYAVASADILHMEMVESITPVPNAAAFVDGIVLSRGRVVPVLNLRARFGFPRTAPDLRTRLLVVQSGPRVIGLLVDSAREFVRLSADAVHPPRDAMAETTADYVAGTTVLGDRIVLVVDLPRLLETSPAAAL